MDQEKIKHLEFIQNIITRMNSNSFQIKILTVTIVSAILAIYVSTQNIKFLILGIVPTLIFWFLDTYFLQQERKFRGIYNDVASLTNKVEVKLFEMPINKYVGGTYTYLSVFKSKTIIWFYLPIIFLIVVSFTFLYCK